MISIVIRHNYHYVDISAVGLLVIWCYHPPSSQCFSTDM